MGGSKTLYEWQIRRSSRFSSSLNIIYRYGVPKYIITDNGKAFDNKMIADLCSKFKIRNYHSTMYYPLVNGLTEAFNKTLCNLMKKTLKKSRKDWPTKMEEALRA
ncbi:hypothetical protein LIER_16790 [Lithospermum erythrorhizon]|uniref:Integrase catalytic domain-containing protein n=1 Tax=Lithospermum erythrorhizon TaxID=34254 RepID=A0AAV3Q9C8_LITER